MTKKIQTERRGCLCWLRSIRKENPSRKRFGTPSIMTWNLSLTGCMRIAKLERCLIISWKSLRAKKTSNWLTGQSKATLEVMPGIRKITVANIHTPGRAEAFAGEVKQNIPAGITVDFAEDMSSLELAVREADIILTATPSKEGLIKADWVRPGTHLSCIGSDMEGKQELELELTAGAKCFADDTKQVIAVGECEKAVKAGLLDPGDITEIGDVILNKHPGRRSDDEITMFDSTGIGLQDLMTASMIIDKAKELNIGTVLKI